ncbi:GTP-binding protein [Mycena sanguinolenta]|uniref:GTP-binding protein n=1 Tax=Mycena sanguinolenta TaxID=230812 RepID=A0A8H6Y918_9AGAR|nr:GTP-binding protein [Mycena sanguinolenta]
MRNSGLDNAGKTTILKKLNGEDILSVSPTLGFNIKTFAHGNYTLNIWDVGGQRTLRPYWRNYFEQTDALVWVVDSGDRLRMKDCKDELHSLLLEDVSLSSSFAAEIAPFDGIFMQRLAGASLLVFANKQDLQGSMTDVEIRDALDLRSIKSHHWKIWSCSAVTGENLVTGRHILFIPVLFNLIPFQRQRFGLGSSGHRTTIVLFYDFTATSFCSCCDVINLSCFHGVPSAASNRVLAQTCIILDTKLRAGTNAFLEALAIADRFSDP